MFYDPGDPFGFRKKSQLFNENDLNELRKYWEERFGPTTTGASTAGTVPMPPPNPKAGEQWWVKAPDRDRLYLVNIRAISNVTVEVSIEGTTIDGVRSGRYERDFFKFLEIRV